LSVDCDRWAFLQVPIRLVYLYFLSDKYTCVKGAPRNSNAERLKKQKKNSTKLVNVNVSVIPNRLFAPADITIALWVIT